jgi:serine/threonine protein kinase
MHILGILHRDIKPSNMMYSKSFGKYVFIDFGISDFKSEKPGELIRSKFLGTYAYCTEEFKKLFKSR